MNYNKIFTLLSIFWLIGLMQKVSAQVSTALDDTTTHKYFLEMIQDPNVNFYEAQGAFNKYWANRTDYKGNGYKVFKRWEYINELRVLPDGKLQAPEFVMKEFNKYMSKLDGSTSASGNWTIQGPTQYFINNTSQPTGMGRVNAIAFHPTDVNTIYIGAPSGGIWKTTNGGITWENLANNLPKLGVSSILIHPTDPNIIYIGTGDRDASDAPGIGVFKSTDGGSTWTQISNTMGNVIVGDMIMLPSDPNTILAATSGGIYKTTNGGATWSLKSGANNFKDIQFNPGDPTIVYGVRITTPSKFYRSTNTGDTWTQITSGIPTTGIGSRMVIGTSPANPLCVYLVQINSADGTFANLLRSTDAGLTFVSMSNSPNIMGYNCDGSGTASQATYDLCINVDPTNANIVFVGGINTWKSIDGGVNWNSSTNWNSTCGGTGTAVHADHHVLEWNPLNGALYLGHDGGITYTANVGSSWAEITGGLPISQIYKIGQGASNSNYTVMGLQDNGCGATINGSAFYTVNGGDGGESVIDYANSSYCYDTYVEGPIRRSTTGPLGSYSTIAANGTNGIDETAAWIIPYFLHKTDHLTMFAGYNNLWRSNNITSSPPTWTKLSTGETSTCRVLEQSAADLGVVYVVRSSSLKRTDNANDAPASVTWTACTLPGGQTPTDLKAHPTNPNVIYATAGYKVYVSNDKGLTWTDLDPNISLPSLYNNCLVYDKNSNEGIYVGNETGVWYKDATMTDWVLFSSGLPPVDVRELEIFYDPIGTQNRLKAGTYGRGLWQSDLYESGVLNPTNITATARNINKIDLSWALTAGNNVILAYSTSPTFGTPVVGTSYAASSTIPGGGTVLYNGNSTLFNHTGLSVSTTYYYKLWSYDGGTIYSTGTTANATTTFSTADFTADVPVSCIGSLTVNFMDASIGAYNSWAWDIDNNGTTDYTIQNPTHTYSSPGLYSVKLTINDGIASITKENLILVMSSEPTVNTGCTLVSNSNSGNGYGIGIYMFALGNIDYTTSNNDGYYSNYTCSKWTTLVLNRSYNITIRTGTANNEGARVYIDYNDNGTFESGESVVSFPSNNTGTRTLSFTTPSSGVLLEKGLRLRVLSKYSGIPSAGCDISTYGQAEDYTVYFINDATWEGDVSANWYTPGNWSYNAVPGAGINAIIPEGAPNYPILTANVNCKNLLIGTGASVTINPGYALTVNGILTNNANTSGLVIKSDATGTGSLIHSTAGVNGTFERYMNNADWADWKDGWHFLSSPVTSQAISPAFTTDPYDFYSWYEPENTWVNFKNTTAPPTWNTANGSTDFIVGKGYMAAYDVAGTKQFTGSLNVADVPVSGLTITGTTATYRSWHLLGNPFASALIWDALSPWNLTNIGGVVKIWNEANQSYSDLSSSPSSVIPSTNGFMVQVSSGTGSLTFPASKRIHSLQPFYKSAEQGIKLVARNIDMGNAQESSISINPEATTGFDLMYDGDFLAGYGPQFYSVMGSEKLSTNSLPELPIETVIPFVFIPNEGSNFKIEADGVESIGTPTWLFDKKTNIDHNLSLNPVYNFTALSTDEPDRFLLHFSGLGVDEITMEEQLEVWYFDHQLFVVSQDEKSQLEVFDLQGKSILKSELGGKGTHSVAFNYPSGFYIVKLTGNNVLKSTKFINY